MGNDPVLCKHLQTFPQAAVRTPCPAAGLEKLLNSGFEDSKWKEQHRKQNLTKFHCIYGILEWFGLGGTSRISSFPTLPWTGTLPLSQADQAPSNLALNFVCELKGLAAPWFFVTARAGKMPKSVSGKAEFSFIQSLGLCSSPVWCHTWMCSILTKYQHRH